jgi:hypothetical protein
MRKAVVRCARPMLTTPVDPTKPHQALLNLTSLLPYALPSCTIRPLCTPQVHSQRLPVSPSVPQRPQPLPGHLESQGLVLVKS